MEGRLNTQMYSQHDLHASDVACPPPVHSPPVMHMAYDRCRGMRGGQKRMGLGRSRADVPAVLLDAVGALFPCPAPHVIT